MIAAFKPQSANLFCVTLPKMAYFRLLLSSSEPDCPDGHSSGIKACRIAIYIKVEPTLFHIKTSKYMGALA